MVRVLQAWPVARSSRQGTTTSASLACRGGGMQNAEATVGPGRFTVGAARFDGGCSDRSCTKQSDSTEPLSVEALCVWTCCIENTCTLNRRSSFLLFSKCSLRLLRSVLRDHCDSLQHYALLLIWTSQDCVIVYCCCSLFDIRKMLQNLMSLQTILQLSNREDQLLRQAPRLGLWPANTTHMHIPPISPSRTFGFSGSALDGISLSRLAWEPNPRLLQTIESWSSAASHFHQKAYENWVSGRLPWTMNMFILGPRRWAILLTCIWLLYMCTIYVYIYIYTYAYDIYIYI